MNALKKAYNIGPYEEQKNRHSLYLALQNPSAEQRFRYQRWRSLMVQDCKNSHSQSNFAQVDYGMKLDGQPIDFQDWKGNPEFSLQSYASKDSSVYYRDVKFESGDVILCNRSRGSDGMFTTLVKGRQSFSHVAVFVLLQENGKQYPAVLEIQQEGVRAVPLKVFLSDKFSTYVEVYRSQSMSKRARLHLSRISIEMMNEVHGFDIMMDESQDEYVSCALMASQLYRRAGLKPIAGQSRYSLKTLPNLQILGLESCAHRDLLMPDDYAKSLEFNLVGVVDNGCYFQLVSRALVRERMQEIWQSKVLNRKKFPKEFPIIKWAVEQIQKKSGWKKRRLTKLFGFTPTSFPSGPSTFIALTASVEARVERASEAVFFGLQEFRTEIFELPSWEKIKIQPEIRSLVASSMSEFESLFD